MSRPSTKNHAFQSAYDKGRRAREFGTERDRCPYPDRRGGYNEMVTFSRAFRRYWREGWDDMDRELGQPRRSDAGR